MFWPTLFSPPGFWKVANWMLPTCCAWVCPGWVTVTVPSVPTVTVSASAGMVMGGSSGVAVGGHHVALVVEMEHAGAGVAVSPLGNLT